MKKAARYSAPTDKSRGEVFDSCGSRLLAFIERQLHKAQGQLARKGLARHEGIHEARKCIRRARVALAIGRSAFGSRGKRLDTELGRICRGLSQLRDAQALTEVLQRLHVSDSKQLWAILAKVESSARRYRNLLLARALERDPQLQGRCQRLRRMSKKLHRLGWDSIGERDVATAIERSERRLIKAGKRVARHPDDNEVWHVYRRRLRHMHQQSNFLSNLGIRTVSLNDAFKAQTDMLGEAQDDVLLIKYCAKRSLFTPKQRRLLRWRASQRLYNTRGSWTPLISLG